MAKTAQTKMPKYLKLLLQEDGATSRELGDAMKRVWGPTTYQLRPIAKREGYTVKRIKRPGELTRYQFVARKPRTKRVAPAR